MYKQSFAACASALMITAATSDAAVFSYYVGVDTLTTIQTGEFAGLANPNANRLTFLYAHPNTTTPASSHYHSKGVYRYQPGSLAAPVVEMSPSNYLPEGALPRLTLAPGSGFYTGKLIVTREPSNAFSLTDVKDTSDLTGFAPGTVETFMFNSSAGRWTGSIAGADVHFVLVSKTPGLNIGSASAMDIGLNAPNDDFHLGNDVDFSPVFWTDETAGAGPYTAQFRLADENGAVGDSGNFEFRFTVVPEPSSVLLSGTALVLGLMRRRR